MSQLFGLKLVWFRRCVVVVVVKLRVKAMLMLLAPLIVSQAIFEGLLLVVAFRLQSVSWQIFGLFLMEVVSFRRTSAGHA